MATRECRRPGVVFVAKDVRDESFKGWDCWGNWRNEGWWGIMMGVRHERMTWRQQTSGRFFDGH